MLTKDIEEKLNRFNDFNEEMIENNAPPELHVLLNEYIADKKMTKADVIRKLNIDRNYGYLILNGKRTPTRNCLIRISIMLGLDIEQINYLLRLAEKAPLYVRNIVDARVFYAVKHHMEYFDAIDFIWDGAL
ncbi:MAG: helix-turn-helix domain-containing protein [Oscillospiraceae bacterium]|nr:helix-turn-helix domain-containing protein [Oscillospiraceae bacterium]